MSLRKGVYRHYKGGRYEVLDLARHSESEETMVIYRSLQGERGLWVRPLEMFTETVMFNCRRMPRFEYLEEANE